MSAETSTPKKASALLDELDAALARESFWLSRWEMGPLLDALPAKGELIEAVKSTGAEHDRALGDRVRELAHRQETNARLVDRRLAEMRRELETVNRASRRLANWEASLDRPASQEPVRWA